MKVVINFLIENPEYLIVFLPAAIAIIQGYIFFSEKRKGKDKTRELSVIKRIASSAECEAVYLLHRVQAQNKSVFKI